MSTRAAAKNELERYLVFAGSWSGYERGWEDFVGSYESRDEIVLSGVLGGDWVDWFHVVDTETGNRVPLRD